MAWDVRYVTDKGKALTLERLFLCKNCDVMAEQVSICVGNRVPCSGGWLGVGVLYA